MVWVFVGFHSSLLQHYSTINEIFAMSSNYSVYFEIIPNESITHLWKLTKNHINIQYDQYSATKELIKSFRDNQERKLTNQRLKAHSSPVYQDSLCLR